MLVVDAGVERAAPGVDLSLWLVDLDTWTDDESAPLPVGVVQRAARFVRDRDRRHYLASQRALRRCVPHGASATGPRGKPVLPGGPHFNLSRREGWAAVARSQSHELGVDLETLRTIDDAAELAALHFSAAERLAVLAREGIERQRAFLTVWTRKEACMKATGLGLALAPSSFECGAHAVPQRLRVEHGPHSWTLLVHTPPTRGVPVVVSWAVVLA